MLPDLRRYDAVGFDTETTGLTYKDRPVGLSIYCPDGTSHYLAWGHGDPEGLNGPRDAGNNVSLMDVVAWAREQLQSPGTTRVFYNAAFDLRMLAYVGIFPRNVEDGFIATSILNEHRQSFAMNDVGESLGLPAKLDTELHNWMARNFSLKPTRSACSPHYWRVPVFAIEEYAKHDAYLALKIWEAQRELIKTEGLQSVYDLETALVPILLKMHLVGVRANRKHALSLLDGFKTEHARLYEVFADEHGDININSSAQLAVLLDRLKIPYPRTTKGNPSIKSDFLEKLDHPVGDIIRQMRKLAHYGGTFIQNYILNNLDENDCIHGQFHSLRSDSSGTRTGRLSSSDPLNLQNIPTRDETWGPRIRSLFIPMRDDQVWGQFDYSQIEYRFFAHYAGVLAQRRGRRSPMEEAYINDPDVDFHQWVATTANIERTRAKTVNFCRLYGGGVSKIASTARISLDAAHELVDRYDEHIPEAAELLADVESHAARRGYVITWAGRKCRFLTEGEAARQYKYPLKKPAGNFFKTYTALNKLLQGSAADLTKRAMVEVASLIDWDNDQMHLTVHDELDFSLYKGTADVMTAKIKTAMEDVARIPAWNGLQMRVPVRAEVDVGPNWGMI